MKQLLIISSLLILVSCGNSGTPTNTPVPTSLEGGTWISAGATTTTELVFSPGKLEVTKRDSNGNETVNVLNTQPWAERHFVTTKTETDHRIIVWSYQNLQSNSATICEEFVGCNNYTR